MKDSQNNLVFPIESKEDYLKVFKEVYFYLYSNSNVSRAEVLIKDISKILLYCISSNNVSFDVNISKAILSKLKNDHSNIKTFFTSFELEEEYVCFAYSKLNEIDVKSAPSHIIGDAFQSLIGPNLRGDKGQFFTPKSVVSSMVNILTPKVDDTICDPACGTGGFLIEALTKGIGEYDFFKGKLIGIEKDDFLANISNAILEIYTKNDFNILNNNSLDIRNTKIKKILGSVDIILTNPPFGAKIGIKDEEILKLFDFGYSWTYIKSEDKWVKSNQVLKEQSPQLLFLELCIKLLKEGGKAGIVLPEGIFGNKSLGYVWDYIRENTNIIGMIDCPRTLFQPSTDVKTNILFFQKGQNKDTDFKVAIANKCGHDKRGRYTDSNGMKLPDDFISIGNSFPNEGDVWKEAFIKDKYYVVPRYCIKETNWSDKSRFDFSIQDTISFKELINTSKIIIRKGNEVGSEAYGTGDIPFVRTSDLINLEINYDPTKSISEEVYCKYKKLQNIKEFDILMVADGRYRIGKTSMILSGMTNCVIQSHLKIIRILDDSILSPFELLYILNQKPVVEQIKSLIFIQSTLGSIGSRLNELVLPIPVKNKKWNELISDFKLTLIERNRLLHKLNNVRIEEFN